MTTYAIRRVLWVIPVLWAVATLTFFLMHAVPGGPFTQDKKLPDAVNANLNRRYHFDEPLYKQYGYYLWDASHGDLGLSVKGDHEVIDVIRRTWFVTFQLGVLGLLLFPLQDRQTLGRHLDGRVVGDRVARQHHTAAVHAQVADVAFELRRLMQNLRPRRVEMQIAEQRMRADRFFRIDGVPELRKS